MGTVISESHGDAAEAGRTGWCGGGRSGGGGGGRGEGGWPPEVARAAPFPGSASRPRHAHAGVAGAAAKVTFMTKWEYATVPLLVHATKQILDTWGEDGWELVQVVPGPNSEQLVAYLKREKQA